MGVGTNCLKVKPSPQIQADKRAHDKGVRDSIFATLLTRQLTTFEVAERIGRAYTTTVQTINGANTCPRTRRKIENFLRQPFWSCATDFAERLDVLDFYGVDLEVLTMLELREQCLQHGLLGTRTTNMPRGYFLDLLMIHYHGARAVPPQDNASQTNETIETRPEAATQRA